jgi:ligand-binding sensor domain-containing protein
MKLCASYQVLWWQTVLCFEITNFLNLPTILETPQPMLETLTKNTMKLNTILFFSMLSILASCNGQPKNKVVNEPIAIVGILLFGGPQAFTTGQGQNQTSTPKDTNKSETKAKITYAGPNTITRNIIQDRKGNIWIAAFDGVFRYDGKSFTNITSKVSSARFFSDLEDRKGNFWFGSIGSGVYYYDGKSFKNFTIKQGLLNNEVTSIYEDKKGKIWFGVSGGASRYDGKSFRNYVINENAINEDFTSTTFSTRRPSGVNSIFEDKQGKFWFATTNNTFVYDGKTSTVLTQNGKPFTNVRSIIKDKKGNFWLGGNDGLWRYNGSTFTNFSRDFVGFIYEDKNGNILTSSTKSTHDKTWKLSRYDGKSLNTNKPSVSEIKSEEGMYFGILEARDGSIWFGTLNGVYRYDGKTFTDFKSKN